MPIHRKINISTFRRRGGIVAVHNLLNHCMVSKSDLHNLLVEINKINITSTSFTQCLGGYAKIINTFRRRRGIVAIHNLLNHCKRVRSVNK